MKILLSQIQLPEKDLRAMIDEDRLGELADSLRDHGQLQAIGIRQLGLENYEVVFGARRTRAAQILGWETINAEIIESANEQISSAKKLIENTQRENLTPIEEAYGLFELIGEETANIRMLQRQTGKSREWIKNRIALLELPDDLQAAVQAGVIGVGVARAFGTIENEQVRESFINTAIENGCTADMARIWANQAKFAETGIQTMNEFEQSDGEIGAEPRWIDQRCNCYACGEMYSSTRVNTLILCSFCQNKIAMERDMNRKLPAPSPLDLIV